MRWIDTLSPTISRGLSAERSELVWIKRETVNVFYPPSIANLPNIQDCIRTAHGNKALFLRRLISVNILDTTYRTEPFRTELSRLYRRWGLIAKHFFRGCHKMRVVIAEQEKRRSLLSDPRIVISRATFSQPSLLSAYSPTYLPCYQRGPSVRHASPCTHTRPC